MSLRMAKYEECDICFDTMKGTAILECGHKMCISCCLKHFEYKEFCPFCRKKIIDRYTDEQMIPEQMNYSWPVLFLSHFEKNVLLYGWLFGMFIVLCILFPNYKVTIEFSQKDYS